MPSRGSVFLKQNPQKLAIGADVSGNAIVITGDAHLDRVFATMERRLQREVLRKTMQAAGTVLARQIRKNIKRMVSPKSRSRGGPGHHTVKHSKGLARSVKTRMWTAPNSGLIGNVVGPEWPHGAHGHLVEFGHAGPIQAKPIPFQRTAMQQSQVAVFNKQQAVAKAQLRKIIKRGF